MSATKLHGPDAGLSFHEATEPTKSVVAEAEAAPAAVVPADAPKAAVESRLSRSEESVLAAPAVQASTTGSLERLTASHAVQQAAAETLAKESQSLGRSDNAAAR